MVDPGEQAEDREGPRDGREPGAQGEGREPSEDPGYAQGEEARSRVAVRKEPERDAADPEGDVRGRREEAEGHVVRTELGPPGPFQEHGDGQDVRVDDAVEKGREGDDATLLCEHSARERAARISGFRHVTREAGPARPETRGRG